MGGGPSKPTPEQLKIAELQRENEQANNRRNEQMIMMQQKMMEKEKEAMQGKRHTQHKYSQVKYMKYPGKRFKDLSLNFNDSQRLVISLRLISLNWP